MTFMRNYHTTCEVSESAVPTRVTKPYTGYQMSYQTLQSEPGRYTVSYLKGGEQERLELRACCRDHTGVCVCVCVCVCVFM